jgi:uncharacterized protein YhbP (UPF0306 family)
MEKTANPSQTDPADAKVYRNQALTLLEHQRTMVLAVNTDNVPWVAPVYYAFQSPGIYFLSSPRSKHIQALCNCRQTAGAIYAESDRWQDIQGLQMIGYVDEVRSKRKSLDITTRYLVKFPMALDLLTSGRAKVKALGSKVCLYVFWPTEIHCTNNTLGFGRRVQIQL